MQAIVVVKSFFDGKWHEISFDKSLALLKHQESKKKDTEDVDKDEDLRDAA